MIVRVRILQKRGVILRNWALNKCGENLILKNLASRLIDGNEKLDKETKQNYSLCMYISPSIHFWISVIGTLYLITGVTIVPGAINQIDVVHDVMDNS